jgi:hypothetical protein
MYSYLLPKWLLGLHELGRQRLHVLGTTFHTHIRMLQDTCTVFMPNATALPVIHIQRASVGLSLKEDIEEKGASGPKPDTKAARGRTTGSSSVAATVRGAW